MEVAILSLNAEKPFNQIEWPYMFQAFQQFGFGENFK